MVKGKSLFKMDDSGIPPFQETSIYFFPMKTIKKHEPLSVITSPHPGTLGPLICSPPVRHVTWCHKIHICATYGNPPAAVSSIENQTKIHKTEIRKSVERSHNYP
jgi:hypothetical protein